MLGCSKQHTQESSYSLLSGCSLYKISIAVCLTPPPYIDIYINLLRRPAGDGTFPPRVEKEVIVMALFMAILATIVGLFTALYVFIENAGDVDDKNFEKNLKISLVKAIATVTIMYIAANFTVYSWTGNSKISEREKEI